MHELVDKDDVAVLLARYVDAVEVDPAHALGDRQCPPAALHRAHVTVAAGARGLEGAAQMPEGVYGLFDIHPTGHNHVTSDHEGGMDLRCQVKARTE